MKLRANYYYEYVLREPWGGIAAKYIPWLYCASITMTVYD